MMKYSVAVASIFAAAAAAQDIGDIPTCATSCLLEALESTSCSIEDQDCWCSEYDTLRSTAQSCLESESDCSDDEVQGTLSHDIAYAFFSVHLKDADLLTSCFSHHRCH